MSASFKVTKVRPTLISENNIQYADLIPQKFFQFR